MSKKEKLRILVVEDTPGDVFLIKFYLEELDPDLYEIDSVDNLADAHKMLSREQYEVVLLDFHLPDSEGMDTLTNSVAKFPDQIFIVLTGLSDEQIGIQAVNQGAQDFLVKGRIDGKVLDSSIKFAVNRSKMKTKINTYVEALNLIEDLINKITFIAKVPSGTFEHSAFFQKFFNISEPIDTISGFAALFDESEEVMEQLKTASTSEIRSIHVASRGVSYKIEVKRGSKDSIMAGIITKLG